MTPALIFDLDGTLWDPALAVANAWNRAVKRLAIDFPLITAMDIRKIAGLPHEDCVRAVFLDLDEKKIQTLNRETQVEDQTIFLEHPLPLFPGVSEGIPLLASRYRLFMVSNCQRGYIENFLSASNLQRHFRAWECWGNTGRPKAENLASLIRSQTLENRAFIGDTPSDEEAARACHTPFFHAGYGYGSAGQPIEKFQSFQELTRYFLKIDVN